MIKAYAAMEAKGKLKPFQYKADKLDDHYVEIDVKYCGLCHSDLSCLENEWGISTYPFVPGHEVIGKISAIGSHVKNLTVGQTVGLGWTSSSCMTCFQCLTGNHNLCPTYEPTMLGRYGGFAEKVRSHSVWAIPIPDGIDIKSAGPLLCAGITVFNPIIQNNILPTERVGVIGIGGLGHLALAFLKAWGCEVTAFSTSPDKEKEAKFIGAHYFINSKEPISDKFKDYFDLILCTINAKLDWNLYLSLLRPKGKLHVVGVGESLTAAIFPMISKQLSIGASPIGSPATMLSMLEFAKRHNIKPITEEFPMSKANDAIDRLKSGKARYRIVLKNDF